MDPDDFGRFFTVSGDSPEKQAREEQTLQSVNDHSQRLYCNLINLYTEFDAKDSSPVLTAVNVRNSLHSLSGFDADKGYAKGEMGCVFETLEEILNYVHRDHVRPNFYNRNKHDRVKLKEQIEKCDDTGCSNNCISHRTFGLEFVEMLVC